jgi:tRNA(fMet)-specific endonuclease VapC
VALILDTNAISAVLEGDAAVERALSLSDRHHLPVIALGEYRYGLLRSRRRAELEPLLDRLEAESIVYSLDPTTARNYADVRDELRSARTPIPENDIWIAALGRQHELAVVSRDGHFDSVRGLKRVSW